MTLKPEESSRAALQARPSALQRWLSPLRAGLLLVGGTACAQLPAPAAAPAHSWDRVPSAAILTYARPLTPAEVQFLAKHHALLVLKVLPRSGGLAADALGEAIRPLKAANPRLKVLFYWNATVYSPGYTTRVPFDLAWCAKRRTPSCVRDRLERTHYDRSQPAFVDWWTTTAAEAVQRSGADGVFVDAVGKREEPAMVEMLDRLARLLKPTGRSLILFNGAAASNPVLLPYDRLASTQGFFLERFDAFENTGPDRLKADLLAVLDAGRRGDVVLFKAWPGFHELDSEFLDAAEPAQLRDYGERLARARAALTFPLACFLAVAQPNAYFQYSWSYREPGGGSLVYDAAVRAPDPAWYPELKRPLGAPRGEPQIDGYVLRRSFEHADIVVDLAKHEGRITWR